MANDSAEYWFLQMQISRNVDRLDKRWGAAKSEANIIEDEIETYDVVLSLIRSKLFDLIQNELIIWIWYRKENNDDWFCLGASGWIPDVGWRIDFHLEKSPESFFRIADKSADRVADRLDAVKAIYRYQSSLSFRAISHRTLWIEINALIRNAGN